MPSVRTASGTRYRSGLICREPAYLWAERIAECVRCVVGRPGVRLATMSESGSCRFEPVRPVGTRVALERNMFAFAGPDQDLMCAGLSASEGSRFPGRADRSGCSSRSDMHIGRRVRPQQPSSFVVLVDVVDPHTSATTTARPTRLPCQWPGRSPRWWPSLSPHPVR